MAWLTLAKTPDFHQIGDDLERLLLELLGQFAHDDRRLDGDDLGIGRQQRLGRSRRGGGAFGGHGSFWRLPVNLAPGTGAPRTPRTSPRRADFAAAIHRPGAAQLWRHAWSGRRFCRRAWAPGLGRQLDKTDLVADLRSGRRAAGAAAEQPAAAAQARRAEGNRWPGRRRSRLGRPAAGAATGSAGSGSSTAVPVAVTATGSGAWTAASRLGGGGALIDRDRFRSAEPERPEEAAGVAAAGARGGEDRSLLLRGIRR